jgi:hypothetical protein
MGVSPRAKILAACLLAALGGGLLTAWATSLPAYVDPQAVDAIRSDFDITAACAEVQLAEQRIHPLRTMKWPIYDFGLGVMLAAATIFLAVAVFRIGTWSDIRRLSTPRSSRRHVLLATLLWISLVVSVHADTELGIARDDVRSSSCDADIRALPITFSVGIWLAPFAAMFSSLRASQATFPTTLENLRNNFTFSGLTVVLAIILLFSVVRGSWTIPSLSLWLYLRLSLGAARSTANNGR